MVSNISPFTAVVTSCYMVGDKARDVLVRSKLPVEKLSQIWWALSDSPFFNVFSGLPLNQESC